MAIDILKCRMTSLGRKLGMLLNFPANDMCLDSGHTLVFACRSGCLGHPAISNSISSRDVLPVAKADR